MNYNELISRFEVYENPPWKKGFDRHHIVPTCEQKKLYGEVTDNRQIYVTPIQHMWLHILYDREHGTNTAMRFLNICGKPAEFFTCYELCLAYSYTLRKKREERDKKSAEVKKTPEHRQKLSNSLKGKMKSEEHRQHISDSMKGEKCYLYGQHHSEETKLKMADAKKGKPNCNKGRKWFNNGVQSIRAYECPEGYVPGRLKRRIA